MDIPDPFYTCMCVKSEPFCCASSRCSPPQRRALQRRVAPFSSAKKAALCFRLLQTPDIFCRGSLYYFLFPSCFFSDVKDPPPPPPPPGYTAPLPSLSTLGDSLCRRVGAAARKHFMQIAVNVTFYQGVVTGAGCDSCAAFGGCGKKRNHEFKHLVTGVGMLNFSPRGPVSCSF